MRYAVYRVCWGEDFIEHSIRAILPFVDKVLVYWDDQPWAAVTECRYEGKRVVFPRPIDRTAGIVTALAAEYPQVRLYLDKYPSTWGVIQHLINERVLVDHERPDTIIIMAADQVWHPDALAANLELFEGGPKPESANTKMWEIWRGFEHYADRQNARVGAAFWNMRKVRELPTEHRSSWGDVPGQPVLPEKLHNFGYCVSPNAMFWKHMATIASSPVIGDSIPSESWFKEKWLAWDAASNNENLEIAAKWTHLIPCAKPYPREELPPLILHDIDNLKRQSSNEAWKGIPCLT